MKKRFLSGLLAAVFMFPNAFAANGDITQKANGDITLVFSAELPDTYNVDFMGSAVAEQVEDVLDKRLDLIGYPDAPVEIIDENRAVSVTLPEDADADAVGKFLSKPGKFSGLDANSKEFITGSDVANAEAVSDPASEGKEEAFAVQLTLTNDGQKKITAASESSSPNPEQNYLSFALDGEEICRLKVNAPLTDPTVNLYSDGFTEESAAKTAGIINIGPLPVTLKLEDTDYAPADDSGQPPVSTEDAKPDAPSDAKPDAQPDTEPDVPSDDAEPSAEPETTAPSFPDIEGHWAQQQLEKAVELGLLTGADGQLKPDKTIKLSEAIIMLNRTLGATVADPVTGLNVPANAWYANDIGKALHIGLIAPNDKRSFDKAATRAEAFELFTRAFAYDGAVSLYVLDAFSDTANMTKEHKNAAAALISAGIIKGVSDSKLSPNGELSRAQFVTMIFRAVPDFVSDAYSLDSIKNNALISVPSVSLSGNTLSGNQVFSCNTGSVSFSNVSGRSRVVLKGSDSVNMNADSGSSVGLLTVDPAGNASINFDPSSNVTTLVIPGRGGAVAFSGITNAVQITSSGRKIDLSGMTPQHIIVTGSGNTITLNGSASDVQIYEGAENNTLILNGTAQAVTVKGRNTSLQGSGNVGTLTLYAGGCKAGIPAASTIDNVDTGLRDVKVLPGVPTRVVPGGQLHTQFKFTGVKGTKICSYQWYQDDKPIQGGYNANYAMSEGSYIRHTSTFEFTKGMPKSVKMGLLLVYDNPSTGETEKKLTEVTVPIENYSDEWYFQRDAQRVLNLVSSTYRGNYTTAYAVNNDYSATEKEVWINAKGYSSSTNYLCWINRAYQHVNVFTGSKGKWKLAKSFIVGTGASGTPTPTGLTKVTYKSQYGWTTGNYTVRPVIGFYPNTGYAFHSRLCYPGTTREYDYSSGYPVSHGCVRMLRSDINWMYANIPVGTTVVIF